MLKRKPKANNKGRLNSSLSLFFIAFLLLGLIAGFYGYLRYSSSLKSNNEEVFADSIETGGKTKLSSLLDTIAEHDSTATPTPTLPPIPERTHLISNTHVFQTFNNCGPSSLAMALSYFDISSTQQTLGQSLRPYQNPQGDNDDKSVTLQELALKAEEFGLLVYHRPAGSIEMLEKFVANDIPVITRTWLKPEEDIGHFRVVVGYDQRTNTLIQDDSLQGNDLSYTYEDFNQLWQAFNYEFLVLVPENKKDLAEQILAELLDPQVAWKNARDLASKQLEVNPNDLYATFNLSVAYYQMDDDQKSIQTYEKVANRLPSRMLWYQIDPILAYYRSGQDEQVLEMSQKILDNQNRAFSELHFLRGQIYEKRNESEMAQSSFTLADQYNSSKYWQVNLD